jgi:hypothetical protein
VVTERSLGATVRAPLARALAGLRARANTVIFSYAVALSGLVYTALYVAEQRFFPYWDGAAYQQFTIASAHAFETSLWAGIATVAGSLSDDYNYLFTVPLVPFLALFGDYRAVFVFAVFVVYFVPYLALAMLFARRVFPQHAHEAGLVAAVATLLTPGAWWHVALGYPDVGGAAIVTAMLLLYCSSERGRRWRPLAWIALLGALAMLFRRHYVYAVVAVYAAFALDTVRPLGEAARERAVQARALAQVAGTAVASGVLLFAVAPGFVTRAMSGGFQASLASWQGTPTDIALATLGTIGAPIALLAVVGIVLAPRIDPAGRPAARVLTYAAVIWTVAWVGYVRQGPYHYPHLLPLFVIVGLTGCWLAARRIADRPVRRTALVALAGCVALNFLIAMPVLQPAIAEGPALPRFTTADPIPPAVNPAYDDIVALVSFLRTHTTASQTILVGASSPRLNYDLLKNAEQILYGDAGTKLNIPFAPQVDSRDGPPLANLLGADIVITATPFQHHLAPDQQKVVEVVDAAFADRWPVANDFVRMPEHFGLGEPGSEIDVYRRVRPDSAKVAADTQRRMLAYVRGDAGAASAGVPRAGGVWVERSSPYPLALVADPSGGTTFTGHPTRAGQEPPTVIEMATTAATVTLTGIVHLYDDRCVGVNVRAGTAYRPGAPDVDVGTFSAQHNDTPFKIVLRGARGRPVFIRLASNPASPDRIEFCTTRVDRLTVKAG